MFLLITKPINRRDFIIYVAHVVFITQERHYILCCWLFFQLLPHIVHGFSYRGVVHDSISRFQRVFEQPEDQE